MVKATRAEKFAANRGIGEHIVELLQTSPDGPKTRGQLFTELLPDFPLADLKTVGNALSILRKKGKVKRLPSTKDRRGYRWTTMESKAVASYQEKPKPGEATFNPTEVGVAVINAIQNMAKRIREQSSKIDQLLNTLSNRQASYKAQETTLRNKIMDQNKIIESLQAQLEPDPEMLFKLSEIANFTGEQDGKT
jgi:Fe2+ or Zn2+ uptake regulation protein